MTVGKHLKLFEPVIAWQTELKCTALNAVLRKKMRCLGTLSANITKRGLKQGLAKACRNT
jgi:hypothetical protein